MVIRLNNPSCFWEARAQLNALNRRLRGVHIEKIHGVSRTGTPPMAAETSVRAWQAQPLPCHGSEFDCKLDWCSAQPIAAASPAAACLATAEVHGLE